MSNMLQWLALTLGILFFGLVVSLMVRRKISEKNMFVWLSSSIIILVLSVNPQLLDRVAHIFGVVYAPSLLFLFSLIVLLLLNLYQSIQISILNDKIKELSQYIAVRDAKDQTTGDQDSK